MQIEGLPTRYHLGTQKAGSTYLHNLLKEHPDISTAKELHLFLKEIEDVEGYLGRFTSNKIRIDNFLRPRVSLDT